MGPSCLVDANIEGCLLYAVVHVVNEHIEGHVVFVGGGSSYTPRRMPPYVQLAIPSMCLSASALFVRRFVYCRVLPVVKDFFSDSIRWSGESWQIKLLAVSS